MGVESQSIGKILRSSRPQVCN